MSDNIVLYMTDISPPCRTVLSVAYILGIDIEKRFYFRIGKNSRSIVIIRFYHFRYISFLKREQFSDWYLKVSF